MHVSSIYWNNSPGELIVAQGSAVEALGYEHTYFRYDAGIPEECDVVLVQGPYASLKPLAAQLKNRPRSERPFLVYWFQQSLNFSRFDALTMGLSSLFSDLNRYSGEAGIIGSIVDTIAPRLISRTGRRLGFLGDILWLEKHNLLDLLVLSSTYYQAYLLKKGVKSVVVPRGFHHSYGENLHWERDIAAVWMGKLRTKRRRNAVRWIQSELEKRALTMLVFDGDENDFIFGSRRTEILNRTKFVLNIFFSGPTDELSIRFFIAGANGTVTMTEPGLNEYPLTHGKHIVECAIDQMPTQIEYYATHPHEWQRISDSLVHLISSKLSLGSSIETILSHAKKQATSSSSSNK